MPDEISTDFVRCALDLQPYSKSKLIGSNSSEILFVICEFIYVILA